MNTESWQKGEREGGVRRGGEQRRGMHEIECPESDLHLII